MSDGLFTLIGLTGAIANGQSNAGNRDDGKICTAQAGECRFNHRYYSPGMRDAKSWSMPCADNTCPDRCPYLRGDPVPVEPEEKRRERAYGLIDAVAESGKASRAAGALGLALMGIDPREVLDE